MKRKPFAFGFMCLLLGWVAAGCLEAGHVNPLLDACVFLVLVFVVAACADRL